MKTCACILLLGLTAVATAQEAPPLAAKKAFDQAREEQSKGFRGDSTAMQKSIALFRKAIKLDPDYYEAHQYYTMAYRWAAATPKSGTDKEKEEAGRKVNKELQDEYLRLAKKHPDKAVYDWVLGWLFEYENPDRSVEYYKQAVKIDPKCGPAYDNLGIAAEEHGDLELSREYEQKAYEAWPNDATIWRHYLGSYTSVPTRDDIDKAVQIILDGEKKFPDEAAHMLSYTAGRTTDEKQARKLYELLRQRFPKEATGDTLMPLFNIYLRSDRAKAQELADSMVENDPKDKNWPLLQNYARTLTEADRMIAAGKAAEATAELDKVKLPSFGGDRRMLEVERAKATAAAGGNKQAYDDLLSVYVKTPSDDVHAALLKYGQELNKNEAMIESEIGQQREAAAKPGMPFTLTSYETGKPVSLSDYKGRVVLVNFWYPKCGPCRGEFPYLQESLEKYKSRGFEILAINGHPPEDEWVMPLIKGWHLSFTPLKGTDEVISEYKVRGFPSNFLYGPDGKIYPMPPQVRPATLRQFQLQVEGLLKEADSMKNSSKSGAGGAY